MSSLKKLESNVDNALRVFLSRMEDFSGTTIDMGRWAQMFAFGELLKNFPSIRLF